MALPFLPSDAGLLVLQAAVVAAPRPMARPVGVLGRVRGWGWALIPVASIVVVIFTIRFVSDTATGLTWLALVAVPPLAAAALGWLGRGARPAWAMGAVALFGVAWGFHRSLTGEACAAVLSALSCVTLGVLLGAVTPAGWLKLGILTMAGADGWLVVSDLLQAPNAALVAAHPPGGLPRLQSEIFGSVTMGYGDLFVAGLLGALLAADRRRQWAGAALTLVIAGAFDVLFLVLDELPATVPVALAMLVMEGWGRWGGGRAPGGRACPRGAAITSISARAPRRSSTKSSDSALSAVSAGRAGAPVDVIAADGVP